MSDLDRACDLPTPVAVGPCIDDACDQTACWRWECRTCGAVWLGHAGDHAEAIALDRQITRERAA